MKKVARELLGVLVSAIMLLQFPIYALAETYHIEDGDIYVHATDSEQKVEQGGQEFVDNNPVITNEANAASDNHVSITADAGSTAHVTISNVSIASSVAAIQTYGDGSVEIKLVGDNHVTSGDTYAGIEKDNNGSLTISSDSGNAYLEATGGRRGAGIGGHDGQDVDDIIITGGNIIADGGQYAAGIGGGYGGDGTNIKISGGKVTAYGGEQAAAIGGGSQGEGAYITIEGNATVTATGGSEAAAIGGGRTEAGTNIKISGGEVTATGGELAAAIGGGHDGAGTNITISGGEVNATGGQLGSGIGSGGGNSGTATGITISGGTVTAVGGKYFPGIGGMQCTDDVIISGSATVNAAGGAGDDRHGAGAAIGTASDGSSPGTIVNGTEKLNSSGLYDTGRINIYPAGTTIAQMSTTQPTTTYIGTIDPNAVIPPNPSGQIDKVTVNDNNNNAGEPNNNVTGDTAPVDEAHAFVASTDAKLQEHINKILALINSGKIAEANALIANGILLDTGRWYTFNKDTCALIEKASQLGIKVTLHYEYDHTKYSTTIPAKTTINPVSLCDAKGFVGFMNFYKYYGGFVRSN